MSAEYDRSESGDIDPLNPAIKFEDDITKTLPQARFHHQFRVRGLGGFVKPFSHIVSLPDGLSLEESEIEIKRRFPDRIITEISHVRHIAEGEIVYEGKRVGRLGKYVGWVKRIHDHNGTDVYGDLPVRDEITDLK